MQLYPYFCWPTSFILSSGCLWSIVVSFSTSLWFHLAFIPPTYPYLAVLSGISRHCPQVPHIHYDFTDCFYVLTLTQSKRLGKISPAYQLPAGLWQVSHFTGNLSIAHIRHNSLCYPSNIEVFFILLFWNVKYSWCTHLSFGSIAF